MRTSVVQGRMACGVPAEDRIMHAYKYIRGARVPDVASKDQCVLPTACFLILDIEKCGMADGCLLFFDRGMVYAWPAESIRDWIRQFRAMEALKEQPGYKNAATGCSLYIRFSTLCRGTGPIVQLLEQLTIEESPVTGSQMP